MLNWPPTLPLPLIGAKVEVSPRGGQIEMESGRVRKRRFYLEPIEVVSVQWTFLSNQFNDFKSFFDETLSNGSSSFLIRIRQDDKEVAFLDGTYSSSHSGSDSVAVTGTLLVLNTMSRFIALSGQIVDAVDLAGSTDSTLQSGATYGG